MFAALLSLMPVLTLFAMLFFHEKITILLWLAIGLITLSGLIISYDGSGLEIFSYGFLLVLAATMCWGLENNCTRNISDKNTYQIVTVKGIFSGLCSLITAFVIQEKAPDLIYILPALLLGFVSYGLSIFTYVRAQETLGAAKTSAYYAVAPFIGALLSFVILHENLTTAYLIALLFMIAGTVLVAADTLVNHHSHEHTHTFMHTHDGSTHSHTVVHSHSHHHYFKTNNHSHTHNISELEGLL